jgi:hypothetical protein
MERYDGTPAGGPRLWQVTPSVSSGIGTPIGLEKVKRNPNVDMYQAVVDDPARPEGSLS